MKPENDKFERLILGIYFENDRLKELQLKAQKKGLRGDDVFEFIHLDRVELTKKITQLQTELTKKDEEIKKLKEKAWKYDELCK